jgi:hypothetical protein
MGLYKVVPAAKMFEIMVALLQEKVGSVAADPVVATVPQAAAPVAAIQEVPAAATVVAATVADLLITE